MLVNTVASFASDLDMTRMFSVCERWKNCLIREAVTRWNRLCEQAAVNHPFIQAKIEKIERKHGQDRVDAKFHRLEKKLIKEMWYGGASAQDIQAFKARHAGVTVTERFFDAEQIILRQKDANLLKFWRHIDVYNVAVDGEDHVDSADGIRDFLRSIGELGGPHSDRSFSGSIELANADFLDLPPEIGHIQNNQKLFYSLENNHLRRLPDELGKITDMIGLNVAHNQLEKIPSSIGKLQLQRLNLVGNPLRKFPLCIKNLFQNRNSFELTLDKNQFLQFYNEINEYCPRSSIWKRIWHTFCFFVIGLLCMRDCCGLSNKKRTYTKEEIENSDEEMTIDISNADVFHWNPFSERRFEVLLR